MKYDLAAMVKRAGLQRSGVIVPPAITPTGAQRDALLRIYMRVVRGWGRYAYDRIRPLYERTLAEPAVRDAITDSVDDMEAEMAAIAAAMSRLVLELDAYLEDWVVRVEEWHRLRFAQSFTPSGVNLSTVLGRGDVNVTLQAVLAENVSLIRSVDDQVRNGISGAVYRGLTNRTPVREVAREIRKVTGLAQARAELIAADQLQKLTARLDAERQQQAGMDEFEWQHSRKQNPRLEHKERDGKRYKWSSTVGRTDPPGRAIRCGCRARPVLDLDD